MHNPNNEECEAACDSECNQAHTHFDENDCTCPTEQKEEWESPSNLQRIFSVDYVTACKIKDFIRTQLALAEERGREATITAFVEEIDKLDTFKDTWATTPLVRKIDLLSFADSLKSNLTQKS